MTDIEVTDLTVSSNGVALVDRVSFRIEPGQPMTLLGETGSGKSLLAQSLMGTLPGDLRLSGLITILGETQPAENQHGRQRYWGHTLALLPQEPWTALDPTMRVVTQVSEGYERVRHGDGGLKPARARAMADLAALGLRSASHQFPFMLSGGMGQRVAFAAVRAGGARLFIADEPTKGLDADTRDSIVSILRSVVDDGGSLLTITHDISVARALGGTVAVMLDGAIVERGPVEVVLSQPQHPYTRRLLAADPSSWETLAPGHTDQAIVLTGRGLSKRFGERHLFDDIDIDIHAGERIALAGPSGSGKTTLGGVLLGLVPPDRGTVRRTPGVASWKFQKLYQDPVASFAPHATLRRLLEDLIARHGHEWSAVDRLLRRVRLGAELLDRRPSQVSGGELQRFALVRVLLLDPVLVFADEPTSRLDPITQQEVLDLLVESTAERGCALLLVTHDLTMAGKLCSRVLALDDTPRDGIGH